MNSDRILTFVQGCSREEMEFMLELLLVKMYNLDASEFAPNETIPIEGPNYGMLGWFIALRGMVEEQQNRFDFTSELEQSLRGARESSVD